MKVLLTQEDEYNALKRLAPELEKKYGCEVEVIKEEDSNHPKAKKAMPGKPAILIE